MNTELKPQDGKGEVEKRIAQIIEDQAFRIILSKPQKGIAVKYNKINILYKKDYYQAECYTDKQVFHQNLSPAEAAQFCQEAMSDSYGQLNAWSEAWEYQMLVSKKGKISFKRKKAKEANAPKKQTEHNRAKKYLLLEGEQIPPLVDMGIFTKEGKVVASMYDKYKQINRFMEIIDDALKNYAYDKTRPLKVVDFGCGKSYLTFVLYYFLTEVKGLEVKMIGLDLKEDVIQKCNKAAAKYGYKNLEFMVGDIGCYQDSVPADMVITLHACDTATDYALFHAIKWNAKMIFSVPCCQHELNQQFQTEELKIIGRYGIVKERTMALMTDAIRANLLECCGYKTQLMEFVDFENTPKNLLIRAVNRKNKSKKIDIMRNQENAATGQAIENDPHYKEVKELMETFHLQPTLYRILKEEGYLS